MARKKPPALFDLTDRKQFLEACHYTNLQPLWAVDNIRKSHSWQSTSYSSTTPATR
jgi:hypothetical protein